MSVKAESRKINKEMKEKQTPGGSSSDNFSGLPRTEICYSQPSKAAGFA